MRIPKKDRTHLTCTTCRIEKPIREFYQSNLSTCSVCKRASTAAYKLRTGYDSKHYRNRAILKPQSLNQP